MLNDKEKKMLKKLTYYKVLYDFLIGQSKGRKRRLIKQNKKNDIKFIVFDEFLGEEDE